MKILDFLIFAILIIFPFSLLAQLDRGMRPVQIDIEGTTTTLYQESHALLIGASNYTNGLKKLPGVEADIQAVQFALENNGFDVTVVMDPDNVSLTNAFNDFIARHGQLKENRLIFYFAGHGYTKKIYDNEIGYLLPVNCPNPETDLAGFQQRAMPLGQIELLAQQIQSKHALFLFDACFSGTVYTQSRDIPGIIDYKTTQPVRQFITSGGADETVPDKSIFCQQLIAALNGEADLNKDKYITGTELGDFIQTTVINYSHNSLHPQFGKIRDPKLDKGDFVFMLNESTVTPAGRPKLPSIEDERTLIQYGKLELTTKISGTLYLDGSYFKQVNANTVFTLKDMAQGEHKIKITADETVEENVIIQPNQTTSLTIDKKRTEASAYIPEMVFIQGGTFQMGSKDGDNNERPVHAVTVGNVYFGKFEITVAQFMLFIVETGYKTDADRNGGSYMWSGSKWEKQNGINWKCDTEGNLRPQGDYNHPVIHISWNDANEYCKWLSLKTGKSFRLPTEAEWEYAAGNGSKHTKYSWGIGNPNGKVGGNVADVTCKKAFGSHGAWMGIWEGYEDLYAFTAPVGSFNPNEFGLYDMIGNVLEYCSDWYSSTYYKSSQSIDPNGPSSGTYHVYRGGSWYSDQTDQRVAYRGECNPSVCYSVSGFRVAMTE
jgi:formylglycine-generating enzyme required for sulfatase activity